MTKQEKIEEIKAEVRSKIGYGVTRYDTLDILRALRADVELAHVDCLGRLYRHGTYICELDLTQTLEDWNEETINKLYELFYE